ncbi:hypothetical protein CAter282_2574 [Collimonas arenae]|uniref:Uncharacterized protein n=1 Tax=Collimonas arenae TaxID=279058 RepID=A0A127QJS6_9BURK|nr:hypothetical protein CAter10_2836 [Collimonas arenae]AMP10311.1 hypothetical protein CAter282_2574 [Collimonas arenae]
MNEAGAAAACDNLPACPEEDPADRQPTAKFDSSAGTTKKRNIDQIIRAGWTGVPSSLLLLRLLWTCHFFPRIGCGKWGYFSLQ